MTSPFINPLAAGQKYLISGYIQITPDLGNLPVAGPASNNTNNHVHADPTVIVRGATEIFSASVMPSKVQAKLAQVWTSVPLLGDNTIQIDFLLQNEGGTITTRSIILDAANTVAGMPPQAIVLSDIIPAGGIVAMQWTIGGAVFAGDHSTFCSILVQETA